MDDQVVAAGLDARRLELLGEQLGDLVELVVPVVAAELAGSVRYSQPRPTGGAMLAIESKVSAPAPIASKLGWIRIRCWVVVVPARSA